MDGLLWPLWRKTRQHLEVTPVRHGDTKPFDVQMPGESLIKNEDKHKENQTHTTEQSANSVITTACCQHQ